MKKNGFVSEYRNFEKTMKEADRIDEIISERETDEFSLPPDFTADLESKEEKHDISKSCEALEHEMANRGFLIALGECIPIKVRYLYTQHVALITEGLEMPEGHNLNFTGCGGWCEGCFQQKWCTTRDEVENEEIGE